MVDSYIKALLNYSLEKKLIQSDDYIFCTNSLLSLLHLNSFDYSCAAYEGSLVETLTHLCDFAVGRSIIEDSVIARDLFDTALMAVFVDKPSAVRKHFFELYSQAPATATDWFYKFSNDTNYIRRDRIEKMLKWKYDDKTYGEIDITVNLSKPEKDPNSIAAEKLAKKTSYPKCQLCKESEGFEGSITFPARQNHRIIPIKLDNEEWYLQYSPYGYYNEHCIAFNSEHNPMKIDESTFRKLLDFISIFPHYFIGSNADLEIVGGSILSHEHFQGGKYEFAMAKAPIERILSFNGFEDVQAGIVKWPMSTIRLYSDNKSSLIALATKILKCWRNYTDKSAFIFAETDGVPHNTITPIARMHNGKYELDLVLRNNIKTNEHPLGVFHPHAELHHIKKENIGLIEVMGLAVLPPRLKPELQAVSDALVNGYDLHSNPLTASHEQWALMIKEKYSDISALNIKKIINDEVAIVFSKVLEHAGVFKRDDAGINAFLRFIDYVG